MEIRAAARRTSLLAPLLDARQTRKLAGDRREGRRRQAAEQIRSQTLEELRQGLVGGVEPLTITIPETGKLLFFAGALPPPSVAVELEVKNR
jgi:hypothetical protein